MSANKKKWLQKTKKRKKEKQKLLQSCGYPMASVKTTQKGIKRYANKARIKLPCEKETQPLCSNIFNTIM